MFFIYVLSGSSKSHYLFYFYAKKCGFIIDGENMDGNVKVVDFPILITLGDVIIFVMQVMLREDMGNHLFFLQFML